MEHSIRRYLSLQHGVGIFLNILLNILLIFQYLEKNRV